MFRETLRSLLRLPRHASSSARSLYPAAVWGLAQLAFPATGRRGA